MCEGNCTCKKEDGVKLCKDCQHAIKPKNYSTLRCRLNVLHPESFDDSDIYDQCYDINKISFPCKDFTLRKKGGLISWLKTLIS